MFGELKNQLRPIPQFSLMGQYAFSIPGTSTEVERLFSIIKDVWGTEKGQMSASTLEAHLNGKFNCEQNSEEIYETIKSIKSLLSQSAEKYNKNRGKGFICILH